ncbi:MAG TPA: NADH-quinone oxidoreductase subunit J [Acidimicrobiales bacterium]|jgi:NADH-quinone oxidoreductase subunit J
MFGDSTTVDVVTFILAAAATLAGGFGVVMARNPVHSALSLVGTLFGIAVLFIAQEAHFLAAVQVIVYAGAIVVLFLFVIMLLGVDREEDLAPESLPGQRIAAAVLAALGLLAVVGYQVVDSLSITGASAVSGSASADDNISGIAESLFSRYVFAFEVTSVLLVIAVVGAVVLARRHRDVGGAR